MSPRADANASCSAERPRRSLRSWTARLSVSLTRSTLVLSPPASCGRPASVQNSRSAAVARSAASRFASATCPTRSASACARSATSSRSAARVRAVRSPASVGAASKVLATSDRAAEASARSEAAASCRSSASARWRWSSAMRRRRWSARAAWPSHSAFGCAGRAVPARAPARHRPSRPTASPPWGMGSSASSSRTRPSRPATDAARLDAVPAGRSTSASRGPESLEPSAPGATTTSAPSRSGR